MKIAITGTHKVGKTTLATALLAHLPAYTLTNEPYYELEASGYIFSEIPDIDDFIQQFDYSANQILQSGPDTIFDRCPIDLLAYIHAIDQNKNIESLFARARELLTAIDLLVFVPIENNDQPSDFPKLRSKVNDILENWIPDLSLHTIEVSGSTSNRLDQLLKKINRHTSPKSPSAR